MDQQRINVRRSSVPKAGGALSPSTVQGGSFAAKIKRAWRKRQAKKTRLKKNDVLTPSPHFSKKHEIFSLFRKIKKISLKKRKGAAHRNLHPTFLENPIVSDQHNLTEPETHITKTAQNLQKGASKQLEVSKEVFSHDVKTVASELHSQNVVASELHSQNVMSVDENEGTYDVSIASNPLAKDHDEQKKMSFHQMSLEATVSTDVASFDEKPVVLNVESMNMDKNRPTYVAGATKRERLSIRKLWTSHLKNVALTTTSVGINVGGATTEALSKVLKRSVKSLQLGRLLLCDTKTTKQNKPKKKRKVKKHTVSYGAKKRFYFSKKMRRSKKWMHHQHVKAPIDDETFYLENAYAVDDFAPLLEKSHAHETWPEESKAKKTGKAIGAWASLPITLFIALPVAIVPTFIAAVYESLQ